MEVQSVRNISEIIEQHLKNILQKSPEDVIEIQRNDLADQFQCVPSQINYVISTRFTLEKGYLVESKRGGGGYIRIQKVKMPSEGGIHDFITQMIGSEMSQSVGEGLIYQLEDARLITKREAKLLGAAISRDVLTLKLPLRDEIRAKIVKSMLVSLLSN
jgi:transcriptional regulator CtsR